ncbi:glycosyltransferase [Methylobacterium iners]|uniref:Glycosyltransferase n=1 Tax=Methylobacterium iners TaxID=418707 RepID=A0ABQ4S7Y4_9HYPH|nr:glycosyltransferase [Methylobacterium iners]GJD97785.1 hypothetical protein OCOJLMKI_5018 [Methylobacterium iners]
MSRRPVGYYVHHQGAGHWQRAARLAAALDRPVTLIGTFAEIDTSGAAVDLLDLPDDRIDGFDGLDGEADRPRGLHYAPLGIDAIRDRMSRIAAWIAAADPVLMVVDVSVEVALLARLLSVPTLVVRLAGERTDMPHLEAFRGAAHLIAPFPAALEAESTPDWVRAKTFHAGFLGSGRLEPVAEDGSILVVYGRGGAGGSAAELAAAARAVPDRVWHVLGPVRPDGTALPPNLHLHGWVSDIGPYLGPAALVVGGGGDGVVAAVAAGAKRFICLAEPRHYDEQVVKARRLEALGAALCREGWPAAADWPDLVRAGLALDPAVIGALAEPNALSRTAAFVSELADRLEARRERPASR